MKLRTCNMEEWLVRILCARRQASPYKLIFVNPFKFSEFHIYIRPFDSLGFTINYVLVYWFGVLDLAGPESYRNVYVCA